MDAEMEIDKSTEPHLSEETKDEEGPSLDDLIGSDSSSSDEDRPATEGGGLDSDDSDDESTTAKPRKRKIDRPDAPKSKHSKEENVNKFFATEAEESGDEDHKSVEEEPEENNYVYDGFVVRDDEDSDDDDLFESTSLSKKKRAKTELKRVTKKKDIRLDEEDLELIRDNIEDLSASTREKVVVDPSSDVEDEDDDVGSGGEEEAAARPVAPLKSMALAFEEDDGSDMDDFLVDESGDEQEPGEGGAPRPVAPRRPQRRVRTGPTMDQLRDASDIFGDGFDDFDDEEEAAGEFDEEGEAVDLNEEEQEKRSKDKMRLKFDRSVLIQNFCTEQDDVIRAVDKPERHIASPLNDRAPPADAERKEEAEWMAGKLVEILTLENSKYYHDASLQRDLRPVCESVLRFYQVEQLEIPFIWTYRRDYLHPALNSKHLWKIVDLDELWERLFVVRKRLATVVRAVNDAAKSTQGSKSQMMREKLDKRQEITKLRLEVRRLKSLIDAATDDHNASLDVVEKHDDQATPQEREMVERTAQALENLQVELESSEELLRLRLDEVASAREMQMLSARYKPEAAAEVLRLFPWVEQYEEAVFNAKDEFELKDISDFLFLLLQGSDNTAPVKGAPKEGDSAAASATDESQESQESVDVDDEDEADSAALAAATANRHKIGSGKNEYLKYKKIPGLREFAELFTLPASELGESMKKAFKLEPPPNPEFLPEVVASRFVDGKILRSPKSVMNAACQLIAAEISAEPSVKQAARVQFRSKASISTRPTPVGVKTINPFSELFGIHYLDEKPVDEFLKGSASDRTLFLRLAEAEKNGLITITVNPPLTTKQDTGERVPDWFPVLYLSNLFENFMPTATATEDSNTVVGEAWDNLRSKVLQIALEKHLMLLLSSELRRDIVRSCRDAIIEQASTAFSKKLSIGPYAPPSVAENYIESTKKLLRSAPKRPAYYSVAAVYQEGGSAHAPMCLAFVDKEGIFREHSLLPDRAGMEKKKEKLVQFMMDNKPDVIVLNASGGTISRQTKNMLDNVLIPQVRQALDKIRADSGADTYDDDSDEDERPVPFAPSVAILSDELANLFKTSPRAKKIFPDLEPGTAAAVCLARYAQEPLAEYCALWTSTDSVGCFGYEALFLDVHPLKSLVRGVKAPLLQALERCLVDAVCEVGVDINKTLSCDHYAPMLAFVAGLGLRKADALRRDVRRVIKVVDSRAVLLSKKLLGVVVYTNAAGFLRVCETNDDQEFDPLDNSRIHPECYSTHDFVIKLCADALDLDSSTTSATELILKTKRNCREKLETKMRKHPEWLDEWRDGLPPKMYMQISTDKATNEFTRKLMPHELDDSLSELVLDEYVQSLDASSKGKRMLQLEQIKHELRYPCLDLRKAMKSLEEKDMFTIITGESDNTLYVGLKIGCTILDISDTVEERRRQRATVKVDNGLRGFIGVYDLVDDRIDAQRFDMVSVLQPGMHTEAVVVAVNKMRQCVDLSIKPSYLSKGEDWWMKSRLEEPAAVRWWESIGKDPSKIFDPKFLEQKALEAYRETEQENGSRASSQAAAAERTTVSNGPMTRVVHHPFYRNCDYKEAEDFLRRQGVVGDMLLRPSSKGANQLAITWAFYEESFKHIDVEERNRKPGSSGLGAELIIQESDMNEVFSDLDQIYQFYITPMNDFVSSLIQHKSFRQGSVEEVEQYLYQQRADNPRQIPYCVRFEPRKPGYFTLTWMSLNLNSPNPVKKELIAIRPTGYRIKGETFARPSDLINWFKKAAMAALSAPPAAPAASSSSSQSRYGSNPPPPSRSNAPPPPPDSGAAPRERRSNLFAQHDQSQHSRPGMPPAPPSQAADSRYGRSNGYH